MSVAMGRRFLWMTLAGALAGVLAGCGAGDRGAVLATTTPPGLAERFYPPEGWAWGFVTAAGGAPQRYGVSAPARTPKGDILILPDYGETAETWFETARDLNALGYVVWVLDGPAQGGSGREAAPRDLGYAPDLSVGAEAARIMAASVIRPGTRGRFAMLGKGVGATLALLAVEGMDRQPDALILDGPAVEAPSGSARTPNALERWLGLDRRRAAGRAWSRSMADDFAAGTTHDPWRGAVTLAWQRANPGLRMGGPSRAWIAALAQARALAAAGAFRVRSPVLVVDGACAGLPHCAAVRVPGAGPALELERDAMRNAWIRQVAAFVGESGDPPTDRGGPLHPPPPPIESAPPAR